MRLAAEETAVFLKNRSTGPQFYEYKSTNTDAYGGSVPQKAVDWFSLYSLY
jgi:hypothetical protein